MKKFIFTLMIVALLASACGSGEKATDIPSFTPLPPLGDKDLRITILYDNTAYDSRLKADWGFAALVEYGGQTLLFDTGAKGRVLLGNMEKLGLDYASVGAVMISHFHSDHAEGLAGLSLNGGRPKVYALPSFSNDLKDRFKALTDVVEVTPGQAVAEGMFTTGRMPGFSEQALVIKIDGGLVVVTGCSHPGIVEIVTQAEELFEGPVRLVVGGFHLLDQSEGMIETIIDDFHRLGVEQVSPTHCTGEDAIAMFAEEYGDDYIQAGAGRVIVVKP
jgi:7,8-dihydropterin-6-yl-methyl-4-(beta-D-ribofuranosyl)aminobenzene 5'-phosphate synthase